MKEAVLSLTGLEIFSIAATLISLFFNLVQYMQARKEKQALKSPLTNMLIALFNDIKSKSSNVYMTQQLLYNPKNPIKEYEALRWEFFQFTQNVINYLVGFQEVLVGSLVTLNPDDKEGNQAFRASDYGLKTEEKELRKQFSKQWQAKNYPDAKDTTKIE